ncbi:hypothetical protein [Aestuariivirga sp.]|uniref:hypothetical protein n=1 Tax=Aestuariivirga sp. TaxID=2650926 RepID=UPI003593D56A
MPRIPEIDAKYLDLLVERLGFYISLHDGTRSPSTAAQHHFVRSILGEVEPNTADEIAYQIFLSNRNGVYSLIQARSQNKRRSTSGPTKPDVTNPSRTAEGDAQVGKNPSISKRAILNRSFTNPLPSKPRPQDEPLEPGKFHVGGKIAKSPTPKRDSPQTRFVSEPWGTREHWKRDSGANWSNSKKNKLV